MTRKFTYVKTIWITVAINFTKRDYSMNKATGWIKRHQIAAFFLITFTISYLAASM